LERVGEEADKNIPSLWTSKPPLPFPEVVSRELAKLLTDKNLRGEIDPD
jgi:hypothetical protein